MYDGPSTVELIEAVKRFIDERAAPELSGHAAFHARVASNVLGTVIRELQQRPAAEAKEQDRLMALTGAGDEQDVASLNRRLCELIREGALDERSPGLLAHLKSTTIDQLSVDQPNYSGLAQAVPPQA